MRGRQTISRPSVCHFIKGQLKNYIELLLQVAVAVKDLIFMTVLVVEQDFTNVDWSEQQIKDFLVR